MKNYFNYLLGMLLCLGMLFSSCQKDDEDPCSDISCLNGGTCINGTCDCPDGFSGPNCEIEDPCYEAAANNTWGYDDFGGPECWSMVCGHDDCQGMSQSPVNITNATTVTDLPSLSISGSITTTEILNNGHTIEFVQQPGSFVTYGKTDNDLFDDYTLGQFHFHANSEHQIDGEYAPLEAHFVCRSIWANEYIVLSVMFEEGASNPLLAEFVDHLPIQIDGTYENDLLTYNPFDLLPANKSYFTYSGSLTTPPCSEVVKWLVMKNRVEASAEEILVFSTLLHENFRPIQPLNGRTIQYVEQ